VVLDTIEALFGELPNPGILRSEIRRLFGWLKEKKLTAVITAERDGPDKLTRHGLEEYVSDCVIVLDHRIREEISTRRLRIVKYRGSTHGTNEYPFLIDEHGISVLPISSLGLDHAAPAEPVTNLIVVGTEHGVRSMLTHMVDFLKTRQITAVFTSLTAGGGPLEPGEESVSSLMDAWLRLESIAAGGERNRTLYVLKSRGMEHSNQTREFVITDFGIQLPETYFGPEGVLTGSARLSQEAREQAAVTARRQETEGHRRELERGRRIFEARVAALRAEFEMEQERIQEHISESELLDQRLLQERELMGQSRKAVPTAKRKGRAQAAGVR
jgi:KaiC/GvpD/RAD55 family RecA-like ATPase